MPAVCVSQREKLSGQVLQCGAHKSRHISSIEQDDDDDDEPKTSSGSNDREKGAKRNKQLAVKGPWSKEEDDVVVRLVGQYGPKRWSLIASNLPGTLTQLSWLVSMCVS